MTLDLQSQGNVVPPKRGKLGVRRKRCSGLRRHGGVGTSSGISLGNLWIIPTVLMKVVRIRNAEIQGGQRRCEETQMVKGRPKENERKGLRDELLEDANAAVPLPGIWDLFLSPAATTSVVGVVMATLQLSKYTVVTSRFRG